MSAHFLPKNKKFWLYHCAGLLAFAVIEVLTNVFANHALGFKIWCNLVFWPVLFTLSVLCFRWLYRFTRVSQLGVGRLIPLVVLYSFAASFVAASFIVSVLLPFFLADFVSAEQLATGAYNVVDVALPVILGISISGHLFIMAWSFIYIFVIENRRARETELSNLRLQNSLKEMQLTSLANQLNPHFLFNALNNIRFMIHENPDKADEMITVLSEIMRYSLTAGTKEQITLAEELDMTHKFVDVIKMQYEDKLVFSCNIPESLHKMQLPPMCLQMLVENAVKHGIEHLREGGQIVLNGCAEENQIRIRVTNPVPALKEGLSSQSTGTGLKNIRERLSLLYGEAARLSIVCENNQYSAELLLPRGSECAH